jgi:diguanylate cyclase (GGDEF)-like protein
MKDEQGQIIGAVEIFSDSTNLNQLQKRVGELEAVAYRDSLTGLPNRRYTNLKIQQTIQEMVEFNRSFGLIVIDVDRFKEVNDLWGHDAGDAVLQTVSETISQNLRRGDLIGRWGGDEFVAIVADVTPSILRSTAERWRKLIVNSQIRSSKGGIAVTASLGATLLTVGDTPESAIQRADTLMYWSKRERNRVTLG